MVEQGLGILVADPEEVPAEVVEEETPVEDETPAEAAPAVDWQARYNEEKTARERAEHKARSQEGSIRRQGETDARLDEIAAHQKVQAQTQAALLAAIETGDSEGLRGKIDEGTQQAREAQANTAFNRYYGTMFESLVETTTDAEGNPLFDVTKARATLGPDAVGKSDEMVVLLADPAFEEVREIWGQALPQGDQTPAHARKPEHLADALKVAHKVSRQALTSRHNAELEAAKKAGGQSARQALIDLDSGSEAGAGSGESWRDLTPTQKIALGMKEQAKKGQS